MEVINLGIVYQSQRAQSMERQPQKFNEDHAEVQGTWKARKPFIGESIFLLRQIQWKQLSAECLEREDAGAHNHFTWYFCLCLVLRMLSVLQVYDCNKSTLFQKIN